MFLESGPEADAYRRARRTASQPLVDVRVDPLDPIGFPALVQIWLRCSTPYGLESSALALLADRAGVEQREVDAILAGHARAGRDRWVSEHAYDPVGRVAVWLRDCTLGRARFEVGAAPVGTGELLAVAARLVGPCSPAILLDAGRTEDPMACRLAVELVGRVLGGTASGPSLVVASSRRAMEAHLLTADESSTKAEVRQSVSAWAMAGGPQGKHRLRREVRRPGPDRRRAPARPGSLISGRSTQLRSVPIGRSASVPRPDGEARSRVELALFRALEADRRTMGRFKLNDRLEIDFGGRPAEVDLVCRRPRLAVEIDGYRHFTDVDAYRRDRRKDLLLQLDGWVVVRVLADDVLSDPASVVDSVAATIADLPKGKSAHHDQP